MIREINNNVNTKKCLINLMMIATIMTSGTCTPDATHLTGEGPEPTSKPSERGYGIPA